MTYFQRLLLLQIRSRCSLFLAHKHLVNVSNIFGLSGIKSFSYLWKPLNFEFVGDFRHFPRQFYPTKTKRYLKSDENYLDYNFNADFKNLISFEVATSLKKEQIFFRKAVKTKFLTPFGNFAQRPCQRQITVELNTIQISPYDLLPFHPSIHS